MQRITGNGGVELLKCVNPRKGNWKVRWDVTAGEDGCVSYMEEDFDHKPTLAEVKAVILAWRNERINERIISGYEYEGDPVWLSPENQFNYKAAYDLAVQSNGTTLPVKFKFGTDEQPKYRVFERLEELADFYTKAMRFIQDTLDAGWQEKDAFNPEDYRDE